MEIRLRFDDASSESADVTELGPSRFRLEHTPLCAPEPMYAGDVIEAQPLADGTHRFHRVVARAPLRHYSWVVPRSFVESPDYRAFGMAIEAAGGYWEGALGGILYVHLPQESPFDPEAELGRYLPKDRPS